MNVQDPKSLKPGEARSEGTSVQEYMDRETRPVPETLRRSTYVFNGSDDLDTKRWTSQEFHDLEMQHVWSKVWQMACREEEIPEVGDHVVVTLIVDDEDEPLGGKNGVYTPMLNRRCGP